MKNILLYTLLVFTFGSCKESAEPSNQLLDTSLNRSISLEASSLFLPEETENRAGFIKYILDSLPNAASYLDLIYGKASSKKCCHNLPDILVQAGLCAYLSRYSKKDTLFVYGEEINVSLTTTASVLLVMRPDGTILEKEEWRNEE